MTNIHITAILDFTVYVKQITKSSPSPVTVYVRVPTKEPRLAYSPLCSG